MKRFMRSVALMLIIAITITTTGAATGSYPKDVSAKTIKREKRTKPKARIKLNKKKATILVKKSIQLKLKNAKARKVKWRSSNKRVATVSGKGKVRARKIGKAIITAKYKGKKYRCKITVKGNRKAIKKYDCKINP